MQTFHPHKHAVRRIGMLIFLNKQMQQNLCPASDGHLWLEIFSTKCFKVVPKLFSENCFNWTIKMVKLFWTILQLTHVALLMVQEF